MEMAGLCLFSVDDGWCMMSTADCLQCLDWTGDRPDAVDTGSAFGKQVHFNVATPVTLSTTEQHI